MDGVCYLLVNKLEWGWVFEELLENNCEPSC